MKWWLLAGVGVAFVALGAVVGWWLWGRPGTGAATAIAAGIGMNWLQAARKRALEGARRAAEEAHETALQAQEEAWILEESARRAGEKAAAEEALAVQEAVIKKTWTRPPPWKDDD